MNASMEITDNKHSTMSSLIKLTIKILANMAIILSTENGGN